MNLELYKYHDASIIKGKSVGNNISALLDSLSNVQVVLSFDKEDRDGHRVFIEKLGEDVFRRITRNEYQKDNNRHAIMLKFKILTPICSSSIVDIKNINSPKEIQLQFPDFSYNTDVVYLMGLECKNPIYILKDGSFVKSNDTLNINSN